MLAAGARVAAFEAADFSFALEVETFEKDSNDFVAI